MINDNCCVCNKQLFDERGKRLDSPIYQKRCIAQSFAEALYNLSDCLRVTENEMGTQYDFIVVKWGEDKKRKQEYEDLKMTFKEAAL